MSDYAVTSTTDTEEQVLAASGGAKLEEKPPEKEKAQIVSGDEDLENEGEGGDETAAAPKKKGGFQKRIDKLTREKAELEARVAKLETSTKEELKAAVKDDGPPDQLLFDTQAEYIAALVKYETAKAKKELRTELKATEEEKVVKAQENTWRERVKAAHEAHPDLEELLEQDLPVSPAVNAVLLDSEVGGELLYHLAANPEELAKISKLSPIAAAKALGLLEDKLIKAGEKKPSDELKPEVKVTKATKPITPVSGGKGSAGQKSPDDMTLAEYRQWRESQS